MKSLLGMVALLASAGAGCGEWREILEKARDFGAGPKTGTTDGTGTGAGGMSGGAPAACTEITEGGDTSCKDSGTWKMYGASTCESRKMVLTDLKFGVNCGPDRYQTATYACCPAPTSGGGGSGGPSTDPVKCDATTNASGQVCKTCWDATGMVVLNDCAPTPPPGGSGGGTCTKITDGGPSSCKDAGTWKMYGAARCAEQKLTLTDVVPQTLCAGGIESVTYVCCGDTSTGSGGAGGSGPAPDPIKCDVITDANGQQCKTCWDATGVVVASDCAPSPTGNGGAGGGPSPDPIKCDVITDANGQQCKTCWDATGVVVASDCTPAPTGAGGSTSTGGGSCTKIIDGGPSSCKDYATWKKYGTDRCAQQKLTLTEVVTLTTCAGAIESVAYVCCTP